MYIYYKILYIMCIYYNILYIVLYKISYMNVCIYILYTSVKLYACFFNPKYMTSQILARSIIRLHLGQQISE